MIRRKPFIMTLICLVALAILAAADLAHGGATDTHVMIHLRLPRVVTAIMAGAALALSGSQMQSVLRNPLADPHIMGVS
ncbi:MAG: iron chelate uptake ABC transporter family permease subunit, partial [Bacteroidales bacterium]|nr:iron chelate uptake ABC transporter family permease subunit [Bacteroidales bacterium]